MSNLIAAWQIVTKEPDAVAQFYSKLFGWKITAANALGYREVKASDAGIDGGIWPSPPGGGNLVQLFVGVDDVARCVEKAVSLGATVIVPRTELPDGDVMAILLDSAGISFGLKQN